MSTWVDGHAPVGIGHADGEVCFVNLPSRQETMRFTETLRESQAGAVSLTTTDPGGELTIFDL